MHLGPSLFPPILVLSLLGAPALGLAHHSTANYDLDTAVEIEGKITQVLWRNPHVRFWIMSERETGLSHLLK
jgi:hypothetical protein